ncbi:hypothetical protein ACQP10_37925 (plasmid) [Streptosporangium sandarakinum]|uniref:hypothetical protein n=1 Tax=Streptosporangium sandarakinum TaxID=1260955 RepID=UPI003D905778
MTVTYAGPGPGALEYKAATPATGVITTGDEGVVEALVSITGVEDSVGDLIVPGAYRRTLAERRPKGIFSHDTKVWTARTEAIEELLPGDPRLPKTTKDGKPWPRDAGALYVKCRFNLATDDGRNAYENVRFFSETHECEWSIGYTVPKGGSRKARGVRLIHDLDLWEYSPVLFGAAPLSSTLSVKAAPMGDTTPEIGDEWADLLADIDTGADAGDDGEGPGAAGGEVKDARLNMLRNAGLPIPMSFEEVRDAIRSAVTAWLREQGIKGWVSVEATFADQAIVCVSREDDTSLAYQVPYTVDVGWVDIGEPVVVTVERAGHMDEDAAAAAVEDVAYALKQSSEWETKAGRVLSDANAKRLITAARTLREVLAAAGIEWDDHKTPKEPPQDEQPPQPPSIMPDSTAPSAMPAELKELTPEEILAGLEVMAAAAVLT